MSEKKKYNYLKELTKGIIKENPVLCLVLGTCPALAVTTAASNAIGMGVAATLVLICSNAVISALRKVIPDKVRIPAYITVIAAFVTIVQMVVKAFAPAIDESLGIYLPLIVVNCIILGRAEMYASKNPVLPSILDGLGMGIGFTAALLLMGSIREILGNGTWFGMDLPGSIQILIFVLPPGGFFVFGMLIALASKLSGKKPPKAAGCGNCPLNGKCSAQKSLGDSKCKACEEIVSESSGKGGEGA
ncbi:MAG: electron transport complex subunit E [Eubacteriales bacterium]|nr:electron transport complex subunit E [Eubacteriales bacterium]